MKILFSLRSFLKSVHVEVGSPAMSSLLRGKKGASQIWNEWQFRDGDNCTFHWLDWNLHERNQQQYFSIWMFPAKNIKYSNFGRGEGDKRAHMEPLVQITHDRVTLQKHTKFLQACEATPPSTEHRSRVNEVGVKKTSHSLCYCSTSLNSEKETKSGS